MNRIPGGSLVFALLLCPAVAPAQAPPETLIAVALYDRHSDGEGTAGNQNRVRLMDAEGATAGLDYVLEEDDSIPARSERAVFSTSGTVISHQGFLKVYVESSGIEESVPNESLGDFIAQNLAA